jgi:hypothetical protein
MPVRLIMKICKNPTFADPVPVPVRVIMMAAGAGCAKGVG